MAANDDGSDVEQRISLAIRTALETLLPTIRGRQQCDGTLATDRVCGPGV